MLLRYKINKQSWNTKNVIKDNLFFSTSQIDDKTYFFNVDKDFRFINVFDRANVINWRIQKAIFNERVFVCNKMLKNDVIYNSSFRLWNINLNNINDINLAINIVIIATTLFEIFIIIVLIFKLIIVIIFNVDIVVIIIIVFFFEEFVFKLIAFDLNIKDCFAINASLDKF